MQSVHSLKSQKEYPGDLRICTFVVEVKKYNLFSHIIIDDI